MQKKDVLRFDYLLNASAPSHRTAIPSKLHLLVYSLFLKKCFHSHLRSDRTVASVSLRFLFFPLFLDWMGEVKGVFGLRLTRSKV